MTGGPRRGMTAATSFDEFKRGLKLRKCAVCALAPDERAVVDEQLRDGGSMTVLVRWLESRGRAIRRHNLQHHFYANHFKG